MQTDASGPIGPRRALFLAVLLLLPVLFFALLEGALRLAGFGGRQPLFIEATGLPGRLHANPDVM